MDLAIEKSLINKNINHSDHNPKIIINGNTKGIQEKVKEILEKSSRIDIAVSYAVWSGLSLIHEGLKKFDSKSRIIVTTDGTVTDIRSLEALKELSISSKVYDPEFGDMGFHLKSYFGENSKEKTLLIGSSNISLRAFGFVHEMGVEIKAKDEGEIVKEYRDTFDMIWNDKSSKFITEEFINEYKEKFNRKKELLKKISDIKLESEITPNYMQRKALEELKECRKEFDRGLVIAATGTGKTYLSAFDVRNSKAKKVLFLVHNRLILTDAIKTFKKIFKDKKILELKTNNTFVQISNADFIFTTDKTAKNTFYKSSKYSKDFFDYIIYDEAHKIGEETIYKNLIEWFNPKFSLGITATPERSDNPKYLFEVFKYNVPYEIRLLDAMEHELVCPFTYYGYNLDERLLKSKEKFDVEKLAVYLKDLIKDKGHYGEKLKGIVFCKDVDEAESLSNEFNKLNIISFCASGYEVDREKIEEQILSLKSDKEKSTQLVCVVDRFNEGVDIPGVNMIIMLRNTTSSIIYLQQLGRGLRRTNDPHKYVTVFDIIGNSKNNYSIAEVLTGNTTVDKRKLFKYANTGFKTVSPFINVEIEKEAMDKIIKSISKEFKVESQLKQKFRDELYRFKEIPTLLELYKNPNFKELELIQLLCKNFYDVFVEKYVEKYNIVKDSDFLSKFFKFITQFIFRAYNKETLVDYSKLLKGEKSSNSILIRILAHKDDCENSISSAIKSDYYNLKYSLPKVFLYENEELLINSKIINKLKEENAYELFLEHIDLIEYLSQNHDYKMKTFDLLDKGEFLFNSGSEDCYMNAIGELMDKKNKKVYCPITISEKETFHDNSIYESDKIIYLTKTSMTKEAAEKKLKEFIDKNYEFCIGVRFPHLQYSNTSYFNMGKVKIIGEPELNKVDTKKYNHKIKFQLEEKIPDELLQYKSLVE